MHIAISVLSLPLLSQRCAHFRWHNAVLVFAVTVLCKSVSNRCGFSRSSCVVEIRFSTTALGDFFRRSEFFRVQTCAAFRHHSFRQLFSLHKSEFEQFLLFRREKIRSARKSLFKINFSKRKKIWQRLWRLKTAHACYRKKSLRSKRLA